jgi:anaerobic magnesium-protoporphyrin IX monomethyl ester cyclase
MRIQLLNPPIHHYTGRQYRMMPPINLPTIAALLSAAGHYAEVIDLEALAVTPEQVEQSYKAQRDSWPDVIGITSMTITSRGAKDIAQALRRAGFDGQIIAGGIYPTENAQTCLDEWGVDTVVLGECEGNVVKIFEGGEKGVHIGERMPIEDIPAPDWRHHNPPIGEYNGNTMIINPKPGISMWSRGCPFSCVFCSDNLFNGQPIRYRPPAIIEQEMRELKRRGCLNCYVYDDELVGTKLPAGWIEEIADRIEDVGLPYITQGHCNRNTITPLSMSHVKRSGCKCIFWGLESFSEPVLMAIKKRITEKDIMHTLRVSHEAGIQNAVFTMIGNYKETVADLEYTYNKLKQAYRDGLIQYRQTTVCTGMPGTPLERIMKDEGWWVEPPEYGPQMAQVYSPTPWLTMAEIRYWLAKYEETCPGVP